MTTPAWLEELIALRGEPAVNYFEPVNLGDRERRCWVWFLAGVNHSVAVDRLRRANYPFRVSVAAANRYAQLHLQDEPTDADMRPLLVLVGLLPEVAHA